MKNITLLSSIKRMPLMELPVQTVAIRLSQGHVLISPGSMMTEDQLRSLDPITDIVAPNLFHSAGVLQATEVFPQAKIWGPKGIPKHKPQINWQGTLSENEWPYQQELPLFPIEGLPALREIVFYHKDSKTLVVTDLFFNIENPKGFGAWIILHLFGTYKRFALSKLLLKYVKDPQAFHKSLEKLKNLSIENIIMSHGEPKRNLPPHFLDRVLPTEKL